MGKDTKRDGYNSYECVWEREREWKKEKEERERDFYSYIFLLSKTRFIWSSHIVAKTLIIQFYSTKGLMISYVIIILLIKNCAYLLEQLVAFKHFYQFYNHNQYIYFIIPNIFILLFSLFLITIWYNHSKKTI